MVQHDRTAKNFPETKRDWKRSKLEDMSSHVQQLQDELVAVDVQLEELKRPVIEPPQLGQYKSIVCGKCHSYSWPPS